MATATSPTFIGRTHELARLLELLERAESGRPAVALVAGDAGVGKTRLLAELAARAWKDGTKVLVGGCLQVGDVGLPYVPFIDAFRDVGAHPDEAELVAPLVAAIPGLGRLLPAPREGGEAPPGGGVGPVDVLDHQHQRRSLGEAVEQRQHAVQELDLLEAVAGRWRLRALLPGGGQQAAEAGHGGDQRRDQLGLVRAGAHVTEGVDERHVGQADVAHLEAPADQHPGAASGGLGRQLGEQAGLADTGLAGHQRHRRTAGLRPRQQLQELGELLGPADERRTGRIHHPGKYRAGLRRCK